jgi:C-terminal processing protease CtpA/Prc
VTQEEEMAQMVRRKKTEPIKIKPQRGSYSVPMAILIDSQSSSAAEMFARHFQRAHKATVVGDRSAGKVVTARYFQQELGAGSVTYFGVNISIGKVLFPGGEDLEGNGVTPDIKCLPSPEDLGQSRDVCYGVALAALEKQLGINTNRTTKPQSASADY